MAKRRTKKQKIKAQNKVIINPFTIGSGGYQEIPVKGYFDKEEIKVNNKKINTDNPTNSEQYSNMKLIKKGIIKSILVSSFILCLIVVIYLTWYK